jgi:two-component system cell cycle response regulator DivK
MIPRILQIEDDAVNLRIAQKTLRSMNYDFLEAANGFTGITIATKMLPHLILLDTKLADMLGYQVIEYLRQQPATARTPMVVLTPDIFDDLYLRCVDAGCDGYVLTPLNSSSLLRTVHQFLSYTQTAPLV